MICSQNLSMQIVISYSSCLHNLKLDEQSSFLTTFLCQFDRYGYKKLPFGADLSGDMF